MSAPFDCTTCGRRITAGYQEIAQGKRPPRAKGGKHQPALSDEWCRYCSRPLSDAAKELEEAYARPYSSADFAGEVIRP